jgi:hypothetical protein
VEDIARGDVEAGFVDDEIVVLVFLDGSEERVGVATEGDVEGCEALASFVKEGHGGERDDGDQLQEEDGDDEAADDGA